MVDRFLRGELVGRELEAFKKRVEDDESFKTEVDRMRQMKSGIKLGRLEEKFSEMGEWEKEIAVVHPNSEEAVGSEEEVYKTKKERGKVVGINWKWIVGVAASVLIISLSINGYLQKDYDHRDYFIPDLQQFSNRSFDHDLEQECYKLYDLQNWRSCYSCLEKLVVQNKNPDHHYFLGISYLGNDMCFEASRSFEIYQSRAQVIRANLSYYLDLTKMCSGIELNDRKIMKIKDHYNLIKESYESF